MPHRQAYVRQRYVGADKWLTGSISSKAQRVSADVISAEGRRLKVSLSARFVDQTGRCRCAQRLNVLLL